MRRPRALATQLLVLQLSGLLVAVLAVGLLALQQTRSELTEREGQRVLSVARAVAATPSVAAALQSADPSRELQPLALAVRSASDTTFVVIATPDQVRVAHPDPALIGQRLSTDASQALAGRDVIEVDGGTLGRTVRGKVPVRASDGSVVGVVSVGVDVDRVGALARAALPRLVVYVLIALALGVAAILLLSRRVRRQTHGLGPAEISGLLAQREATLQGVREGLLVVDDRGTVSLVNAEATRLLGLPDDALGRPVIGLDLPSRVVDVLTGSATGDDLVVLRAGRILAVNRRPVVLAGRDAGAVVTLRDRTELDELTGALAGARTTTEALRAQAHEFSNRMHTVAGLLELGEPEEALAFVSRGAPGRTELARAIAEQVQESALAALLLAKASWAAERGVDLQLAPSASLAAGTGVDADALVTVVGNLVANAVEALHGGGWVRVDVRSDDGGVLVDVRDSGAGVAPELVEEVFRDGFTTKVAEHGGVRGLGLALTRQACVTRGGWVQVEGSHFRVLLPFETART